MSRLYPAEITAIEANIARSVKTGKEHIGERLEQLDPASARYAAQSKELMREFNALETTVTANAIQPLLTRWRREKEVGGN